MWQQCNINPITASACKISGLKNAHIHACTQCTWWSYNKSTFNTAGFHRNPFMCSCEGESRFHTWCFYGSFLEWRCSKHGRERVNCQNSEHFIQEKFPHTNPMLLFLAAIVLGLREATHPGRKELSHPVLAPVGFFFVCLFLCQSVVTTLQH